MSIVQPRGRAPMRGAWIEIAIDWTGAKLLRRRAPMRGAWIEIRKPVNVLPSLAVAPPCGARGLKSLPPTLLKKFFQSRPHAGRVD